MKNSLLFLFLLFFVNGIAQNKFSERQIDSIIYHVDFQSNMSEKEEVIELQKIRDFAGSLKNKNQYILINLMLAKRLAKMENPEISLKYYRLADSLLQLNPNAYNDSVHSRYFREHSKYYKIENGILENELQLNKDKQSRNFRLIIIISLLAASGLISLYYFQIRRKKELASETQERIDNTTSIISKLEQKVNNTLIELIELAKADDPAFVSRFKVFLPEFYHKLIEIQPDLTNTELKICFLIKLSFSTKEIAQYTFVTPKAIQNRKNRLRKRLNLEDREDIYKFLEELGKAV